MLRENNQHIQQSLIDSSQLMSIKIKEKLKKSWAPIFYENVFCKIDEKPFAQLYGIAGNPNFPVNILLSLEYIKHMKEIPDSELMDDFYFDYLVNYTVGIRTLGEKHLSNRTLYNFRKRIYKYSIENPDKDDDNRADMETVDIELDDLFQDFLRTTSVDLYYKRIVKNMVSQNRSVL